MSVGALVSSVADLLVARSEDDRIGFRFEDEQWSWREVVDESAARSAGVMPRTPSRHW